MIAAAENIRIGAGWKSEERRESFRLTRGAGVTWTNGRRKRYLPTLYLTLSLPGLDGMTWAAGRTMGEARARRKLWQVAGQVNGGRGVHGVNGR